LYYLEKETDATQLQILPYLQTLVDRDNQLYAQVNLISNFFSIIFK
jgi:hypothetical protein